MVPVSRQSTADFARLTSHALTLNLVVDCSARERLERLAWEAKRATEDYLAALTEFEKDRDDDAGRRADEQIAAGSEPF